MRYAEDSHGHNDHLSGLTEVAGRGEVQLPGSVEGEFGYAHWALRDGEQLEMGEVGMWPAHRLLVRVDLQASARVGPTARAAGAPFGSRRGERLLGGPDAVERGRGHRRGLAEVGHEGVEVDGTGHGVRTAGEDREAVPATGEEVVHGDPVDRSLHDRGGAPSCSSSSRRLSVNPFTACLLAV